MLYEPLPTATTDASPTTTGGGGSSVVASGGKDVGQQHHLLLQLPSASQPTNAAAEVHPIDFAALTPVPQQQQQQPSVPLGTFAPHPSPAAATTKPVDNQAVADAITEEARQQQESLEAWQRAFAFALREPGQLSPPSPST